MDSGEDRPEKEKLRANSELMLQTKMLGCVFLSANPKTDF